MREVSDLSRRKISGTTWNIYLFILTSERSQGVREVWRALKLSTPSLAQYHVNKLVDMKLIELTSEGKYQANEMEQMGVLRNFVLLRGRIIPRLVFYGSFLLGILIIYLLLWPFRWDFRDLVVLIIAIISISAFFFEAYNQHRGLIEG